MRDARGRLFSVELVHDAQHQRHLTAMCPVTQLLHGSGVIDPVQHGGRPLPAIQPTHHKSAVKWTLTKSIVDLTGAVGNQRM